MGTYTKNLFKRNRVKKSDVIKRMVDKPAVEVIDDDGGNVVLERISSCAIIRDEVTYGGDFRSHADIRRSIGDKDPYTSKHSDIEGFLTSTGRFVSRRAANEIGHKAGQCQRMTRKFLSSDIDYW